MSKPAAPPTSDRTKLSVRCSRSRRRRLPPSAVRIASSRRRVAPRATSRLATFEQAIKSTQKVAASKTYKAVLASRSEEHTSELQSRRDLVCRLLLEKKKRQRAVRYVHRTARRTARDQLT